MLAFVAAEPREFSGLLRSTELATRLDWPLDFARMARLKGNAVLLLANGPGPKLAARAVNTASQREKLDALVSVGFCGGLDPDLVAGDIFIASEVLGAGTPLMPSGLGRAYKTGKLLSIDRVACTVLEKEELRKYGADVIDMEAGAVAQRAEHFNIPFYAIRVVTDAADEELPMDFNQLRDKEGRFDRMKILGKVARQPRLVPALLKLNQRCNTAAQILGDFLADTRF